MGADKPALTNLLTIYGLLAGEPAEAIAERYAGKGYAELKQDLAEVAVQALAPFQARMRELSADKTYTLEVLKEGPRAPKRSRAHDEQGARAHRPRAAPGLT